MIVCFSGTGNSKFAAERLAATLGEVVISVNDRLRDNDTSPIAVNGRLIVVTPTYAWRIPRVVRDWLLKTDFSGVTRVWFVMTCGSEIGSAAKYNRALCGEKGFAYGGTAGIVMPENYIAMFSAPDAGESRNIVDAALPAIDRAAGCIAAGEPFPAPRNNLYDRFMSRAVNPVFYGLFVKDGAFTVGQNCTGCGVCASRCPLNNITLQGGKPVWGGHCTHCMACICYCPAAAIEYGKKSVGQPRYHIEAVVKER